MKNFNKNKKLYYTLGAIVLCAIVIVTVIFTSSNIHKANASNLMNGIMGQSVKEKYSDDKFINNVTLFSYELFNKTRAKGENSLISPMSVMVALSMTANGSDHETLSQMNSVLAKDIPLEELNQYLNTYIHHLPENEKTKMRVANSIWYRDSKDLKINNSFLQTNANYYQSAIFKSPFNNQTKKDINKWVKTSTDGLIDKMVDKIDDANIMYLINTVLFDAGWEIIYENNNVGDLTFHNQDGSTSDVRGMHSMEELYIQDEKATGFMKSYYNNDYRFVALLPNEGISLDDYLNQLTGDKFIKMMKSVKHEAVVATLPKFKSDYTVTMNNALMKLGMTNAFSSDNADFSKMGSSSDGNLYIDTVFHKTYISVDELGTKAGAATKVSMNKASAQMENKVVYLDRPFFYAIIDTRTNIPIFMGTVNKFQ